ncbi:MAG: peptide deformylase, partial [Candidatus Muiribacteriota bacterium]
MFKITYYGDEILRKEAEDVVVNSETLEIAKKMVNAMKIYKGIGLAAPQVGISKKIIVIQLSDDSEPMFFFNVKILEKSA